MKNLSQYEFLTDEKYAISDAINHYGTGDHPISDEKSFGFFKSDYALQCLTWAIDSGDLDNDTTLICERARHILGE
jgi:hypothetical protein